MAKRRTTASAGEVTELGPCPKCGKREGSLAEGAGRFPYMVFCKKCGFTTDSVRVRGVAVKLWNEAKPAIRAAREKLR